MVFYLFELRQVAIVFYDFLHPSVESKVLAEASSTPCLSAKHKKDTFMSQIQIKQKKIYVFGCVLFILRCEIVHFPILNSAFGVNTSL